MIQVKIFQGSNMESIQAKINDFFKKTKKASFIQATQSETHRDEYADWITVMIWYWTAKK